MIYQARSSAGIWLHYKNTDLIIDPGPGALVRCRAVFPRIDPAGLDGILLTHKHLDHANDVNVMIEAMTQGGRSKRGELFVPGDALDEKEGVVLNYLRRYPAGVTVLKPGRFSLGDVSFSVVLRNRHPVETYGIKFFLGSRVVSFVSDTEYFADLSRAYSGTDILVLNVVTPEKRKGIQHLSLPEAVLLCREIRPGTAVFTHFGMSMLDFDPQTREEEFSAQCGVRVKCAYDGMVLDPEEE